MLCGFLISLLHNEKVSELVAGYKKIVQQEKADRDKTKLSRKHKHFGLLVWHPS